MEEHLDCETEELRSLVSQYMDAARCATRSLEHQAVLIGQLERLVMDILVDVRADARPIYEKRLEGLGLPKGTTHEGF